MSAAKSFACCECGRTYKHNSNLRKHVSQAHPEKLNVIAPLLREKKVYRHVCELCNRKFNHLHHLRYHLRKEHGSEDSRGKKRDSKKKCPLCEYFAPSRKSLYDHLEKQHQQLIKSEEVVCDSFGTFLVWKQQIENNTLSRYVKEYTFRSTVDSVMTYIYKCHRSGVYAATGKGIRHLKRQGSNKIGSLCPASIRVSVAGDGKCKITYISTHVGHDVDIRYLTLTKEERMCLAEDIAKNIPYDEILKKVRGTASTSKQKRIHLITRKDLENIAQANNFSSDFRNQINNSTIAGHVIVEIDEDDGDGEFLHEEGETEVEEILGC